MRTASGSAWGTGGVGSAGAMAPPSFHDESEGSTKVATCPGEVRAACTATAASAPTSADRMEVRIDTSYAGGQTPVTLHGVNLWDELGVNLQASYPLLCFDPRGLSIPSGTCTGTRVVVRLERGADQDSVVVSSTGRVSR